MVAAIEFVKSAFSPKIAGSEIAGHVLALARSFALDWVESSDFAKHNFMQFANGNHPTRYEWTN